MFLFVTASFEPTAALIAFDILMTRTKFKKPLTNLAMQNPETAHQAIFIP